MSRYIQGSQRVTYATRLGIRGQPLPQQGAPQSHQQSSSSFPTNVHGGRHAETNPVPFPGKHGPTILMDWKAFQRIAKEMTVYQISRHKSYGFVLHTQVPENVQLRANLDEVERLTAILPENFRSQSEWWNMLFEKVFNARIDMDRPYILKYGCTEDVYDQYLAHEREQWKDEHEEGDRGRTLWRQQDQHLVPKGEQWENEDEHEECEQSRVFQWLLKN